MQLCQKFFKRGIDIVTSGIALLTLSLPLALIAIWLHFVNKGAGAFFTQERPGLHGKIFRIYKFKTMTDERDEEGNMSLIGPRPLLPEYLALYTPEQARRHDVRPGITGWAQCHGRNSISWTEKFKLDVWYVDNCSFVTDCKVIIYSIRAVFNREGISSSTCSTMETFDGTN